MESFFKNSQWTKIFGKFGLGFKVNAGGLLGNIFPWGSRNEKQSKSIQNGNSLASISGGIGNSGKGSQSGPVFGIKVFGHH